MERKSILFREELSRKNYVTPTSFLELLSAYGTILRNKRKTVEFSKNRLVAGLKVLEKAGTEIAKLNEAITIMMPTLEKT